MNMCVVLCVAYCWIWNYVTAAAAAPECEWERKEGDKNNDIDAH